MTIAIDYRFTGENYELMPVYGRITLKETVTDRDVHRFLKDHPEADGVPFPEEGLSSEEFREWITKDRYRKALCRRAYAQVAEYSDMIAGSDI